MFQRIEGTIRVLSNPDLDFRTIRLSQFGTYDTNQGAVGTLQIQINGGGWQNMQLDAMTGYYDYEFNTVEGTTYEIELRDTDNTSYEFLLASIYMPTDLQVCDQAGAYLYYYVRYNIRELPSAFRDIEISFDLTGAASPLPTMEISVDNGANYDPYSWGAVWSSYDVDTDLTGPMEFLYRLNGTCTSQLSTFNHDLSVVPFGVSYTKQDASEAGVCDGAISLLPVGGSGNYSYDWSDGATSQINNALCAGTYTVTVTDTGTLEEIVLEIVISEPLADVQLTEKKRVKIERPCYDENEGVYLAWLNTLGGWDYWLFHKKPENFEGKTRTKIIDEIKTPFEQLDEIENDYYVTGKTRENSIKVGDEGITIDEIEGLKDLLSSSSVFMLISAPGVLPPQWREVTIDSGSFSYDWGNPAIQIEIRLPDTFVQTR